MTPTSSAKYSIRLLTSLLVRWISFILLLVVAWDHTFPYYRTSWLKMIFPDAIRSYLGHDWRGSLVSDIRPPPPEAAAHLSFPRFPSILFAVGTSTRRTVDLLSFRPLTSFAAAFSSFPCGVASSSSSFPESSKTTWLGSDAGSLLSSLMVCSVHNSAADLSDYYPLSFSIFWLIISTVCWFALSHFSRYEYLVWLVLPREVGNYVLVTMRKYRGEIIQVTHQKRQDFLVFTPKYDTTKFGSHQQIVDKRFDDAAPMYYYNKLKPTHDDSSETLPTCPSDDGGGASFHRQSMLSSDRRLCTTPSTSLASFASHCRIRSMGFLHAVVVCPLAFYCVALDPCLTADKMAGLSPAWTITGFTVGGYFIWDLITVCWDWRHDSWQWLIHAIISLFSLMSPFFSEDLPMCYFAAALLLFEASTPFMALRFFCIKAGVAKESSPSSTTSCANSSAGRIEDASQQLDALRPSEIPPPDPSSSIRQPLASEENSSTENAFHSSLVLSPFATFYYQMSSVLFAFSFLAVRVVWAGGWLFPQIFLHLLAETEGRIATWRRYWYFCAIPVFYVLNLYWAYLILGTLFSTIQKSLPSTRQLSREKEKKVFVDAPPTVACKKVRTDTRYRHVVAKVY